jgi:hypothetical protein
MTYENKDLIVEIVEVNPEESTVTITNEQGEGTFKVEYPAKIKYAKTGEATIKFDKTNQIVYLRMKSAGAPKPKSSFPQKQPYVSNNFKKAFGTPNSFKPADKVAFHYESEVTILEGVTLTEFKQVYNDFSKQGRWIVASNIFPTPITAKKDKDTDPIHILYDAIIYEKVKKEGGRNEEIPETDQY